MTTIKSLFHLPKSDEARCNFLSSSSPRILLIEKDNGCRWAGSKEGGLREGVEDLSTGDSDVKRVAMGKNEKLVKLVLVTSILPLHQLSDLPVLKPYLYTRPMTVINPLVGGPTEKHGVFKRTDWIGKVRKQQWAAQEKKNFYLINLRNCWSIQDIQPLAVCCADFLKPVINLFDRQSTKLMKARELASNNSALFHGINLLLKIGNIVSLRSSNSRGIK